MTQEEKDLLLRDLCARLPYGTKVKCHFDSEPYTLLSINWNKEIVVIGFMMVDTYVTSKQRLVNIKPYLRPMSSMTEEEKQEYEFFANRTIVTSVGFVHLEATDLIEWLLKKHFDFMGLIPMGAAIEVTEENNPYKN